MENISSADELQLRTPKNEQFNLLDFKELIAFHTHEFGDIHIPLSALSEKISELVSNKTSRLS